jgi:hypothetical protein
LDAWSCTTEEDDESCVVGVRQGLLTISQEMRYTEFGVSNKNFTRNAKEKKGENGFGHTETISSVGGGGPDKAGYVVGAKLEASTQPQAYVFGGLIDTMMTDDNRVKCFKDCQDGEGNSLVKHNKVLRRLAKGPLALVWGTTRNTWGLVSPARLVKWYVDAKSMTMLRKATTECILKRFNDAIAKKETLAPEKLGGAFLRADDKGLVSVDWAALDKGKRRSK